MRESESITNNLLIEVESLTYRLRNIKYSFNTTSNQGLKERLFFENKNIFERINEIHKIAKLLNTKNSSELIYSNLLIEKTKRTINEFKCESNLFFL